LPYLDHLAAGFRAPLERYLPERHAKISHNEFQEFVICAAPAGAADSLMFNALPCSRLLLFASRKAAHAG
jgi:hypothetical protein